jgi:DNA-binding response OmpR family regulator
VATEAKRILVVDDDADIVESLKMVLESANYDVDTAGSLRRALPAWRPTRRT